MRPADPIAHVRALHAAYEARTSYSIRWNLHRENQWSAWCRWADWEWTDKELALVIGYLRTKINKGERNDGALKFDNLIGQPDRFEEDLNLAKEARRTGPCAPRRPPAEPPSPAPPEDDFKTPEERAAHFRSLRDQL